jgi:hypothetical protein
MAETAGRRSSAAFTGALYPEPSGRKVAILAHDNEASSQRREPIGEGSMSEQKLQPKHRYKEAHKAAEDAAERLSDVCTELQDAVVGAGEVDAEYVLHELAQAQSAMSRARSYCESLAGEED